MHTKDRHYNKISVVVFFLVSFGLGFAFSSFFVSNKAPVVPSVASLPIRLGADGLINPLLYVADRINMSPDLDTLKSNLNQKITESNQKGLTSAVGIYFNDLTTGRWMGINENEKFAPASLLKVPVMMAYLKIAETTPSILENSILYDGSFDGNKTEDIKPTKSIEVGHSYTIDNLLKFMIQYSDNNADLLLVKYIGDKAILDVIKDVRITYPTSTPINDFVSPREYSRFFRVLYSATYLNREMSKKGLELLSRADFPQGIESGVPENIIVAEKFGERYFANADGANKELHDCGIVYHPKNPYLICIMTKGTDLTKMTGVVSNLSSITWQSVNSGFKN